MPIDYLEMMHRDQAEPSAAEGVLYAKPLTRKRRSAGLRKTRRGFTTTRARESGRNRAPHKGTAEAPPMAKESKSKRKAAGKRAWKKRVEAARKAGKKRIKVGKHLVDIGGRKSSKRSSGKSKKRGGGKSTKRSSGKRGTSKRGGGRSTSKSRSSSRSSHRSKSIMRTEKVRVVKVPSKTRVVRISASEARRRGRKGGRRHHRGYAMENPLTGMELFAGGLTMLLGLGVADGVDRLLATHALTGPDANGNFVDTVPVDSTGKQSALPNGAAVMAPMNLTRWGVGLGITIVPFIAAAYIKSGTYRSALQFFGFGAGARVLGKGAVDLFARLMAKTGTGQRLYANEIAGINQAAVLTAAQTGQTQTTFPNAPAPGLGLAPPGLGCGCGPSCGCNSCRARNVANAAGGQTATPGQANNPPPPPAVMPPGSPPPPASAAPPVPPPSSYVPVGGNAVLPAKPSATTVPPSILNTGAAAPVRANPYDWANQD